MLEKIALKLAMTLDGKIATRTGQSKWITGPLARQRVMRIRSEFQAILTGVNTVIADNPSLNVRDSDGNLQSGSSPIRVVLDSHGRIPLHCNLLNDSLVHQTIVMGGSGFDTEKKTKIQANGAKFVEIPLIAGRVSLPDA